MINKLSLYHIFISYTQELGTQNKFPWYDVTYRCIVHKTILYLGHLLCRHQHNSLQTIWSSWNTAPNPLQHLCCLLALHIEHKGYLVLVKQSKSHSVPPSWHLEAIACSLPGSFALGRLIFLSSVHLGVSGCIWNCLFMLTALATPKFIDSTLLLV